MTITYGKKKSQSSNRHLQWESFKRKLDQVPIKNPLLDTAHVSSISPTTKRLKITPEQNTNNSNGEQDKYTAYTSSEDLSIDELNMELEKVSSLKPIKSQLRKSNRSTRSSTSISNPVDQKTSKRNLKSKKKVVVDQKSPPTDDIEDVFEKNSTDENDSYKSKKPAIKFRQSPVKDVKNFTRSNPFKKNEAQLDVVSPVATIKKNALIESTSISNRRLDKNSSSHDSNNSNTPNEKKLTVELQKTSVKSTSSKVLHDKTPSDVADSLAGEAKKTDLQSDSNSSNNQSSDIQPLSQDSKDFTIKPDDSSNLISKTLKSRRSKMIKNRYRTNSTSPKTDSLDNYDLFLNEVDDEVHLESQSNNQIEYSHKIDHLDQRDSNSHVKQQDVDIFESEHSNIEQKLEIKSQSQSQDFDNQSSQSSIFDTLLTQLNAKKPANRIGRMKGLSPEKQKNSTSIIVDVQSTKSIQPTPTTQLKSSVSAEEKREVVVLNRKANAITYGKNSNTFIPPIPPTNQIGFNAVDIFDDLFGGNDESANIDEGLETSDDDKPKVKGSHELCRSGNSKMVLDEIHYLFEGITDPSLNIKRSTSMEIFKKLSSYEFINNLRIHAKVKALYELLSKETDLIISMILIFQLQVLAEQPENIDAIISADFISWCFNSFKIISTNDPLIKLPKKKYDKTIVEKFRSLVDGFGYYGKQCSTTRVLCALLSQGLNIADHKDIVISVLPDSQFIQYLLKEFTLIQSEIRDGLDSVYYSDMFIPSIHYVAKLDNITESFRDPTFLNELMLKLFQLFDDFMDNEESTQSVIQPKATLIQQILQIFIHITTTNTVNIKLPDTFLGSLIIRALYTYRNLPNAENWLDFRLLIFELLSNLATIDSSNVTEILNSKSDVNCMFMAECRIKCKCDLPISIVEQLVQQLNSNTNDAQDPMHQISNIYLAIFLAHLIRGSAIRLTVLDSCRTQVMGILKEYLQVHDMVVDRLEFLKDTANRKLDIQELINSLQVENQ
ncbi:hypothetical protein BC833DRAFT_624262 [Globomyces pollinis-pini]|nr:hypothetical protein BC833DRAFT_624262 [Globomyces pollinis-pini]